ncbi:MAG: hypothetical protein KKD77_16120 [Gammaproteobacteria bacterium]|nr:hypothetical protein [Gammaproteobacteria bacterium]
MELIVFINKLTPVCHLVKPEKACQDKIQMLCVKMIYMVRLPQFRTFIIFLSVLLALISSVDLSINLIKAELGWPTVKSAMTLMLSILMYLFITKPALFKR